MDTLCLAARSSAPKACSVKGCVSVLPYASTSSGSESNARFKPASALYLPSFAPEPLVWVRVRTKAATPQPMVHMHDKPVHQR